MHNRLNYSGMLYVALAALAVFVTLRSPREPEYEGLPLNFWVEQQAAGDLRKERAATEAIQAIGAEAVPHLIPTLTETESRFTTKLVALARRIPFVRLKYTPLRERQRLAAKACEALGPQARAAIPALANVLTVPELTDAAAAALAQLGPESIPYLTNAAHHNDGRVRFYASHALGVTRGCSGTTVPADRK